MFLIVRTRISGSAVTNRGKLYVGLLNSRNRSPVEGGQIVLLGHAGG